ncbi:MAG: sugar phosphate isomerase/epimerase [Armatimonadetes bacterium]|nr:sugar phosphate isomerase/epimerase [Armatimonadota bacterium]
MDRRDFLRKAAKTGLGAGLAVTRLDKAARAMDTVGKKKEDSFRKALIYQMLPESLSPVERFKLAKNCGFDGIELPPVSDPKELEQIHKAIDVSGIPVHSIIFGGWQKPLSHPDDRVAEEGLEEVRAGLKLAADVGADGLLLVPGVVNAQTRYVEAWERSRKRIKTLIPLARQTGVTINIEEVWNKFLLSPLEFARYIDEFKSPWVRAYFDVANVIDFGWPQDWIRTLGSRIAKVHVKDYKRENRSWPALGEGDADFPEIMSALKEVKYSGWLTCELPGGDEGYLLGVSRRMDKIISGLNPLQ